MSQVMREAEVREDQMAELLEQVDLAGAILVERESGQAPVLVLPLGQPGRAAGREAIIDDLKTIRNALQGQPGRASAIGQMDGLIETLQGHPGRA